MARCTIWPPRFRKWFQKRFGDLREEHDKHYMLRYKTKSYADMQLAKGIWDRGYKALAVGAWIFCQTVGWWYWVKR
jgi:hypothetical protein